MTGSSVRRRLRHQRRVLRASFARMTSQFALIRFSICRLVLVQRRSQRRGGFSLPNRVWRRCLLLDNVCFPRSLSLYIYLSLSVVNRIRRNEFPETRIDVGYAYYRRVSPSGLNDFSDNAERNVCVPGHGSFVSVSTERGGYVRCGSREARNSY